MFAVFLVRGARFRAVHQERQQDSRDDGAHCYNPQSYRRWGRIGRLPEGSNAVTGVRGPARPRRLRSSRSPSWRSADPTHGRVRCTMYQKPIRCPRRRRWLRREASTRGTEFPQPTNSADRRPQASPAGGRRVRRPRRDLGHCAVPAAFPPRNAARPYAAGPQRHPRRGAGPSTVVCPQS